MLIIDKCEVSTIAFTRVGIDFFLHLCVNTLRMNSLLTI